MAMDNALEKPDLGNIVVLEEKIIKPNSAAVEEGHVSVEANKDDQIESAKAKMGEVKEENERLKLLLSQLVKNYESLQMRFVDILRQEEAKTSTDTAKRHQENEEEADLVSLSLGRGSGKTEARNEEKKGNGKDDEKPNNDKQGLALGLECKSELEPSGSTEPEEDEPTEIRPPSKVPKTEKNEDVSDQMHLKKPRVSVRARCDTPTMNDGCQWRKYGQKIAKGNPCPRAYYRCTISPTCPVRKQVQRCATDMSVLITTYEGNHNHPLPLSATAMASTTSAAASMLLSQSSTSTSTSSSANLHGLNFNFSQNPRPYYFPNSSISTFNSHPTITLDLTSPHNSSYFARLNAPAKYSSTCLNFSSSPSSSSSFETSWNTSQLNFGAFPNHKDSLFGPLMNLGRQPSPGQMHQSCMQMSNQNQSQTNSHQQSLSETIAAATKVITSDLTFRSALAAALTSFVGNGGGGSGSGSGNERKWGDNTHHTDVENEVSTLGKSPSMVNSHQQQQKQGSLLLFPTSLPFPTSKSTASSAPPEDHN